MKGAKWYCIDCKFPLTTWQVKRHTKYLGHRVRKVEEGEEKNWGVNTWFNRWVFDRSAWRQSPSKMKIESQKPQERCKEDIKPHKTEVKPKITKLTEIISSIVTIVALFVIVRYVFILWLGINETFATVAAFFISIYSGYSFVLEWKPWTKTKTIGWFGFCIFIVSFFIGSFVIEGNFWSSEFWITIYFGLIGSLIMIAAFIVSSWKTMSRELQKKL